MDISRSRGRRGLLLVITVFAMPLLAAFVLYYWAPASFLPGGRTNHGHLVTPARPLGEVKLVGADGQPLGRSLFENHWTLLYLGSSECADSCRNALYYARQVHIALGRDQDRVQRVYVSADRHALAKLSSWAQHEHSGMHIALAEGEGGAGFLGFFQAGAPAAPRDSIYLLDPLGNWLMVYQPGDPPKGMLTDLKKLLRLSSIG
jgi:cytochrome oxidase Cu insertion factor (SCO1/SenC/PrrC family)